MSEGRIIFTTSWDDGTWLDLKVAELLDKYELNGTFYPCRQQFHIEKNLSENNIRNLNGRFEVGAHSLSHRRLTGLPKDEIQAELSESKSWIEDITSHTCELFCPPFGAYDQSVIKTAENCGYLGIRSTNILARMPREEMILHPTFHVYPYPFRRKYEKFKHYLDPVLPVRENISKLHRYGVGITSTRSWLRVVSSILASEMVSEFVYFHIFGHAHEIEKYSMWAELEQFLTLIGNMRPKIIPTTNAVAYKELGSFVK